MELKQFLELFNPLPGSHYMQVTNKIDVTTFALHEMMQSVDGEFRLVLYEQEEQALPAELLDVTLQRITNNNTPFRARARDHDIVIFKDIFAQHTNPKLLLKIAYTTLANSADIIIMEKKGVMDIEATKNLLEQFEFRAPNAIDVLDAYDLVMAKKMHMWGNGL